MHEYIIEVLIFAITVIGIILTRNVIPYLKTLIKSSEYAEVYDMVETAVKAAEQKCTGLKQGKAKKSDVYAYISHWLLDRGIHLTEEEIERIIECAVYQMNNE